MIYLRPHHLLCTQFFEGKGYSPEFTEHMAYILDHMTEDTEITITDVCDELCSYCPFQEETRCASQEKVQRYDAAVMKICHLQKGEVISFMQAQQRVRERIIDTGNLHTVCGDCSWFELCSEIHNRQKQGEEE